MADRPPILALIVDDPPHRADSDEAQQDKAVAAGEAITGWLREYGLDVQFGGLLTGGAPCPR